MSDLAQWLAEALRERGLTHFRFAVESGIGLRTISGWMRGETVPRYPQLVRLVNTLGELPPELAAYCADRES